MRRSHRPHTPSGKYSFRYWRRRFKPLGLHLDPASGKHQIGYSISGWVIGGYTLDPGKYLYRHVRLVRGVW